MLFTNGNYFVFLAAVFFVYWLLAAWRLPRIWLLLAASYYFYALWNPKFLALIILISTFDFLNALGIGKARSRTLRKSLVGLSVLLNVGALFLFKYFNRNSAPTFSNTLRPTRDFRSVRLRALPIPRAFRKSNVEIRMIRARNFGFQSA